MSNDSALQTPTAGGSGNNVDGFQDKDLETARVGRENVPFQHNNYSYYVTSVEQQRSEPTDNRNTTTEEENSNSSNDLGKFLEDSGLDFEDDFGQDFSRQLCELTLRQWIGASKPDINFSISSPAQSSNDVAMYIKSALLIALKLTECIMEAEKDERNGLGNPIPLDSINIVNVMVRSRKGIQGIGKSTEAQETIEFVWVMSIFGDESATGTVMARLFAVGKVLYELFSTIAPMVDDELSFQMASMDSINLGNEVENGYRAQKKKHWRSTHADDTNLNYVARLESMGIPWSLCALVKNLLECRHGTFCADDVYASFDDLHVDLQLMVDNPSCFLDNIPLSTMSKLTMYDKLYGRDEELLKLEESYQSHISSGKITGAVISGGAGAGKSKLAMHMQKLTMQSNGYFLSAKFEQNQMSLKPLSTITNMFDSLCEMVFNDTNPQQLTKIEKKITNVIGGQSNLLGMAPNLGKLIPTCLRSDEFSSSCVDSAVSMRYLLCEVLRVISSHSKPITFVIDDIQFADRLSLLLVGNLLFKAQGAPIFFALCHRDDESSMSEPFKAWLNSIAMFALTTIKLGSITAEAVNNLISEALHLSPRLTRPLSSVLQQKTRGNPLFLRQLLDSLTEQGYIYIDMKQHRWAWALEKIMELEISNSVLALLMNDIKRLPSDLQFGLQVAACIGSCVTESMLIYVSIDLGLDLKDILQQVSYKGFMIVAGSSMFRFAHDKIQEAVYELMPEQQRREIHMRCGLALCTRTLDNIVEDEELFFVSVNQINQGGPSAVQEPSQMNVIAQLNLKAGRRSIELSDYNTALMLFQHGISFLGDDDWVLNYQLSLDLYDAVAEAALVLNKLPLVSSYANVVFSRAGCFDDKLHCTKRLPLLVAFLSSYDANPFQLLFKNHLGLIITAKALGVAHNQAQSIEASFEILIQFGEDLPRDIGDGKLRHAIDHMNNILRSTSDDTICNMQESNDKKMTALIDLYEYLAHVLQYFKPILVGSVSLRIVELTMITGLSAKSPLAFAHFGGLLSSIGCVNEGCRLGKLALKLVEKKGSLRYKSSVICFVYESILWATEPMQLLVEAHSLGHKAGQQSGDIVFAFKNLGHAILTDYVAGQILDTFQKNLLEFLTKLQIHGLQVFSKNPLLLLSQVMVLKEGLHMSSVAHVDKMTTEPEILADARSGPSVSTMGKLHHLTRAFLFRQLDDMQLQLNTLESDNENFHQLHFLFGSFFEGLASFQLARQTSSIESTKWSEKGQLMLTKILCRSDHSLWNWENKVLLLEAESMHTKGDFQRARTLYDDAIRSAREHKFIHEEAIASELAGSFYCERGFHQKSYAYLVHSVECYEKWGAHAVARRVEAFVREKIIHGADQFESNAGVSLEHLFVSIQGSKNKRREG